MIKYVYFNEMVAFWKVPDKIFSKVSNMIFMKIILIKTCQKGILKMETSNIFLKN